MEFSTIKALLALAGGPAFAVENGVIFFSDPKAAALGLSVGAPLAALLPDASLPTTANDSTEVSVILAGRNWTLHAVAADGMLACFLRPIQILSPAPNESTLLHTAGIIRLALQNLLTALEAMADTVAEDPDAAHQASLALRSVYRLRRTAGDLELLAALCAGTSGSPAGTAARWPPPQRSARSLRSCSFWPDARCAGSCPNTNSPAAWTGH